MIYYADQAVERLQRKYHRMIYQGKPRNVVITAVARELARFIWGIDTKNKKESYRVNKVVVGKKLMA